MKRITAIVLAITSVLALGSGLASCSTEASAETPAYLFVFDGFDATMTPAADTPNGSTPDTYAFAADLNCTQLVDCSPVAWFTDRPVRDSGTIDLTSFVALWSSTSADSFQSDPPNVAIEVPARNTTSGEPETIISEMSAPALHTDPVTGIWLSATMTLVPTEQLDDPAITKSHLGAHTDSVRADVPNTLGDVTVFVDDAGTLAAHGGSASASAATASTLASTTTTTCPVDATCGYTGPQQSQELPPPKNAEPTDPGTATSTPPSSPPTSVRAKPRS